MSRNNFRLHKMFSEVITTKTLLRIFSIFSLFILLVSFFSSCAGRREADTSAILSEMIKSEKSMPVGKLYSMKSTPGSPDYISPSLLAALYGEGNSSEAFAGAEDISLRLSSGIYCFELAVFLCRTTSDAHEIADLCLRRINMMEHFLNANSEKLGIDPVCRENIKNAKVKIVGRYVLMAVSPNAAGCIESAKNIIS